MDMVDIIAGGLKPPKVKIRNTMKNINDFNLEGVQLDGDGKKGKKVFENDDQVMDFYKYLQECEEIFKSFEKARKRSLYLANIRQI